MLCELGISVCFRFVRFQFEFWICTGFCIIFIDLKEIASLLETAAYTKEVRRVVRAVRLTMALRRKLNVSVLSAFLNFAFSPGSEAHTRLSSYLPKVIFDGLCWISNSNLYIQYWVYIWSSMIVKHWLHRTMSMTWMLILQLLQLKFPRSMPRLS